MSDEKRRAWITRLFSSAQGKAGGVIRCSRSSIEKQGTVEHLRTAIFEEGFHLVENGDQLVIFCNTDPLTVT